MASKRISVGDLLDDCGKVALGHAAAAVLFGIVYGWEPVFVIGLCCAGWCAVLGVLHLFGENEWPAKQ